MKDKQKSRLFSNKSYLSLISAQTVSALGDWLDILAIITLVAIHWNASPFAVTGIMLCLAGPSIVLGPLAGALADRLDRKKIMIVSNLACAGLIVCVAFTNSLWQVFVLITLKSIFEVLFMPAKNGKLKEIVHDDDIQMAMSVSSMIDNAAKVIGPTVGGILVATLGVKWAFYIDGMTFLLSALLLLAVPKSNFLNQSEQDATSKKLSFQAILLDLKDGISILKGVPILLASLFLFSLALLVLQIADTQFSVLLRLIMEDPTKMLGFVMASSGIGMFVSAALISKMKLPSVLITTSIGCIFVGAAFGTAALLNGLDDVALYIIFPVICFFGGASFGLAAIPFQISIQKQIPVSKTGRVFGTIGSVTTISAFIGMISGGILSTLIGVVHTFILAGGSLVLIGTVALMTKKRFEGRDWHVTESDGGIQREAKA
ncbi:MFS transporter [Bacillus salitolerans]|uniref:MFS transporter n=1 Tax=Bacillus salitolerans TaxID=1437434 RepID=A0ABW4LS92_9BACI